QHRMHALNLLLFPWGSYLLIRLLGEMGAGVKARRSRLYLIGAVLVTAMVILFLIARSRGLVDDTNGLSLINDQPWVVLPGLFLLALFGIIVAWFFIEVVRLGIRLLRTKGYTRWIGGGAVASTLLTLLFGIISGFSGVGLSDWLSLFASYCSFVAVPVSITVFLAIRSAHHNRLVERQRDDLDREVQERTSELRAERDRSEALLLNILPAEVAEELKVQGEAAARHFDLASVLFTDFKGFTTVAAQVDPTELVQELNACFRAFDDIIDARGIEKIKTIGDAYMCAGGLPDPRSASALDVVLAALEMQEFMQGRKAERTAAGRPAFDMRLGIHSGPVVAGIVGVKKFQYDIWGDTVNTASRMESTGDIGRVNISSATYELVKDAPGLVFTARGEVDVKGKGMMEMYFVQRG
ncbi:MAG TPA: adenylate/guanylate cyclase domain-containing protein, partial [Flavobacteriales bacterium]|nr:adenylate/guanylate cyclase domain-containing protein [Flavobacteriales bacterium]